MSWQAWIFLVAVWGLIIGSTAYCFWKLLTSPRKLGDWEEKVIPPTP